MSEPGPKSVASEDKNSLPSADADREDEIKRDSVAITPKLKTSKKLDNLGLNNNGFLSAPLSGPVRPLSPDTLSNLSLDEYEQIRPGRRSSHQSDGNLRSPSQSPAPPSRGVKGRLDQFWIRNKGLAYMLLGQVFGTLMNVTTRLLEIEGNKGKGLHPFQILFARMGITLVLASGYMWWKKTPHFPFGMKEVRWLLVFRSLGGFCGVFGMYYSLLYLPLADATVITFLAPSLACWACSILIKEPFTRVEQIAALVSLVGVVLIARPTSLFARVTGSTNPPPASGSGDAMPASNTTSPGVDAGLDNGADASNYENVTPMQRLGAVGIAMIGVCGSVVAYTTIRWIGKRAHPLISVNCFAAGCFVVSIIMQSVLPGVGFLLPADAKEWGYLIFLGTCGFVMQFLLAAGLAYEKSSRATNMIYTQMFFALGFDKIIFGHTPDIMSILGSSLILGSAIIVAVQKSPNQTSQKESNADGRRSSVGGDEESRTGLMSGMENSEGDDRLPVQEVQLRTLR